MHGVPKTTIDSTQFIRILQRLTIFGKFLVNSSISANFIPWTSQIFLKKFELLFTVKFVRNKVDSVETKMKKKYSKNWIKLCNDFEFETNANDEHVFNG